MSDNPYAPPSAELEVPVAEGEVQLASLGKRLGAAIIDTIILIAIQFPLLMISGYWNEAMEGRMDMGYMIFAGLSGIIVYLLINGYLLAKRGQSVGKMLLKTQIVSVQDGRILPLPRLVGLRLLPVWVVSMIPLVGNILPLIDVLFIFRKDRRCVHDLIAGTRVVDYQAA